VESNGALHWSERTPLSHHPAFATDDPEIAMAGGTALLAPHRLRLPAGADGFAARVNARRWKEVMLAYFSYGTELQVLARPLADIYAVNLPLTGHADVRYRGTEVHSSPNSAVVFSPTEESSMRWSADHTVLCVTIERQPLERHLARMLGRQMEGAIEFVPEMPLRSHGMSWGGVIQLLIDVAERTAAGQSALLTAELEVSVMTTLLLTQPHNYSAELLDERPAAPARIVRRAIEVMRSVPRAGLTVPMVAERVGVSERSLQKAFRRELSSSPSEQLREVRLDGARRDLVALASDQRSVSQVAADWGFVHLGRFAATYRRRFGENPSQTLRGRF
jgi:AraC-like DNA-binding protein